MPLKAATMTPLMAATTLRSGGNTSMVDTDLQQPVTVGQL